MELKIIKQDEKYIYCELPGELFKGKIPKKVKLIDLEVIYD